MKKYFVWGMPKISLGGLREDSLPAPFPPLQAVEVTKKEYDRVIADGRAQAKRLAFISQQYDREIEAAYKRRRKKK